MKKKEQQREVRDHIFNSKFIHKRSSFYYPNQSILFLWLVIIIYRFQNPDGRRELSALPRAGLRMNKEFLKLPSAKPLALIMKYHRVWLQ